VNRLAIFDIDGTLTDTTGVDDECYRTAIADSLGVSPEAIDWSGAAHVTDSEIFRWLCAAHRRSEPSADEMTGARSRFVEQLTAALEESPTRFTSIAGAPRMLRQLVERGWSVAVATGGWGPSARLKLRVAELPIDDAVFACADDARSRADIVQLARVRAEAFYQRRFDRVVSVGDGVWDVETAIVLGLPFVGIATGARADRLRSAGARAVLPDYSNLDAVWTALDTATPPSPSSHHPLAVDE
jgi:phosphoglycolate phosphatase-like HAD superfamily hydrolase